VRISFALVVGILVMGLAYMLVIGLLQR